MRNSKIRGNIIMLFTLLYIVYLSVVTYLLNSQGLFISLVDVSILVWLMFQSRTLAEGSLVIVRVSFFCQY